jgi:hypothetical protein
VDHSLKIMDGVLRHRIIRLKDGSPPPPTPAPDRRGGYGDYEADGGPSEAPAADVTTPPEPSTTEATPEVPEGGQPAEAPAETPPPPEVTEQEAGPAGGGEDDEAPSGPTAA